MRFEIQQVSSLEKVRKGEQYKDIHRQTALAGERVSWQVTADTEYLRYLTVSVDSPLAEHIRLYRVQEAVMDLPATEDITGEDYLAQTAGTMPDILMPLAVDTCAFSTGRSGKAVVWVNVDLPQNTAAGEYPVRLVFTAREQAQIETQTMTAEMTIVVKSTAALPHTLPYTRWFYLDCIAVAHDVPVFSERHWQLIEKYIEAAPSALLRFRPGYED